MAPKKQSRQPTKEKAEEKPPKPSSDDEEEDNDVEEQSQEPSETDDDDDASSEEQEQQQQQQQKEQLVKTPITAPKLANGSDSESETDSESGSESEEVNPSAYKVQPIMPKPAPAKRAHQENDDSRTNTSKKVKTGVKKDEKKTTTAPATSGASGLFTRLWSNEDEIAVLKGMLEFKEQKGVDPSADLAAFHSFVKGKLEVDFSKDQLKSKISRLKKRFANASKRGEDPVFSNPHEVLLFEIAKRIWGGGAGNVSKSRAAKASKNGAGSASKDGGDAIDDEDAKKVIVRKEENGVVKKAVVVEKEGAGEEFWSKYSFLKASFDSVGRNYPSLVKFNLVKEKLSLIGSDKAKELDDKWRQLIWEEVQLNYKMLGLMNEQAEMALSQ